jgi:hypothetical protein
VTEAITVAAKEATVDVSDAQGGRIVAMRDIEVLPQLERNPIILAIFQPGVQIVGGNIGFSRVNGTRLGSNVVKIDGIDSSDGGGSSLPFRGTSRLPTPCASFAW